MKPVTLTQKIQDKADACKTAEEAMTLCVQAPKGSKAKEIYGVRWVELADAEAPAKVAACETKKEVYGLLHNLPHSADKARKIYEARIAEIYNAEEAPTKARACQTADDARRLYNNAPDKTPRSKRNKEIYMARWVELADAEAPAKAVACKTASEAEALYDKSPDRFSFPKDCKATKIYRARWIELSNAEAPAKAAACKISEEAWSLYNEAPDFQDNCNLYNDGTRAKRIYYERYKELADAEAPAKAVACKVAAQNCKTKEEVWALYEKVSSDSEAGKIYGARWVGLADAEAPAKAAACKTAKKAMVLYNELPRKNNGHPHFPESKTFEIYGARLMELADAEAPAKAAACKMTKEVERLLKEVPVGPNGSKAKEIYEARWMELHLEEA